MKRRRGADRWFESVTWEIGSEGRELHTPGGLYLLLLELTARIRTFCDSPSALCVWRNGHRVHARGTRHEHYAPFEADLRAGGELQLSTRAATRTKPVLADLPAPTKSAKGQENALPAAVEMPLQVTFNKVKTSIDTRRTAIWVGTCRPRRTATRPRCSTPTISGRIQRPVNGRRA